MVESRILTPPHAQIAGLEKEEAEFGKKLASQEAAIKQAAEARLMSKKIGAAPVQLAQPGSPQAQQLCAPRRLRLC